MGEHQRPKLFLALPSYGFQRYNTNPILQALVGPKTFDEVIPEQCESSLLAHGFNTLWAHALALRPQGLTHFLMLHADIVPVDVGWLNQLHQEMIRVGAQVLSVVVPYKGPQGLTTTAVDPPPVRRFTMKEIMAQPETFTHPDLLLNTGLMLVSLQEDWGFSRQARRLGVPLWATRKVRLTHVGIAHFPNFQDWGSQAYDVECQAACQAAGREMPPLVTSARQTNEGLSRPS